MINSHSKQRPVDDGGLGIGVSIVAAFAIALVLGLAFWTLNDGARVSALDTTPSTSHGITTGIAPPSR